MTTIFGSSIVSSINKYGSFPSSSSNLFASLTGSSAVTIYYLNNLDVSNGAVYKFDNATVANPIPVPNIASHVKFNMVAYVNDSNDIASDGRVYTRGCYNGTFTNWVVMPGTDPQNVSTDEF